MSTAPAPTGSSSELGRILDGLDLEPLQREMLRDRWLGQAQWHSRKSAQIRRRYYALRLPIVLGSLVVPALVSMALGIAEEAVKATGDLESLAELDRYRWLVLGISFAVAGAAALEEIFKFGERWGRYRRTAELLKSIGWRYLALNGPFERYDTHRAAFGSFTSRVEDILNDEVEGYVGEIAASGGAEKHEVIH